MSPPQSGSARITVLLGRTREDRRRASRTLDALGPFQQSSLLYLTRAQHKVELVRASFWDQPDKPPTFLPEVRTWGSFRDELHQRFGDPKAVLSPIATEMLVGRLWPALRTTMKRWGALPDTPTMRRELAGLIDNWGHSWSAGQPGASQLTAGHPLLPTDEVTATPSMPPLGHEIRHDLQLLLSTWAQVVQGAQDWTDRAGAGQSLLQILRAPEPPPGLVRFLRRFQSVVVDDLLWLSPLDLALLDSLVDAFIRWIPDSKVHLCLEESGQSPRQGGQDTPGRRVTRGLRHIWQTRLDDGSASALEVDSEPHLLDLADHLVHDSRIPRDSPLLDGPVRVRHYGSERTEVRAIARLLRAELLAGRAASDCYVAFPSLDRYLPILRDALHSYGIPFSVRKGHTLSRSPPVSAARLVLRMALDGPQRESLRNLLASGWVRRWYTLEIDLEELADTLLHHCRSAGADVQPDHRKRLVAELQSSLPAPGRVRASMDRLHSLCLRTGARGGEPRKWLGPISAQLLHDQWQRQRRRDPNATRGQLDPESFKRLARLALDIEAMEAIARPIRALNRSSALGALADSYDALLDHLGLFTINSPDAPQSPSNPAHLANQQAINTWRETIHEVATAAEAVATLSSEHHGPATHNDDNLTLLWEALEAAARDGTYQASDSKGGVSVVGLRDLHGADVPWLWLGGCIDGEFPRAHRPSFLLPPEAASHIPRLDTGDEDRTIFLSLLRNIGHGDQRTEASLFISRPGTVGGKDVSASPLLQDLRALRIAAEKPTGTDSTTTAGEVWDLLQAKEEAQLPPVVAVPELLVHPEFHADKPELAQFLSPTLRERTTAHNQWCLDLANPTGFGPRDGLLALGRAHRAQVIGWLHDGLRVDHHGQRQRLTLPVTGLELWARCPIRFFFSRVLRADEPEEWSPEPSARDEGVLLHRVLERLLQERLEAVTAGELNTASLEGLDHDELAGVKRRAAELVRELAPEVLTIQRGPYRDRVLRLLTAGLDDADHEAASFQGKLASFLEEETTAFLGLEPAHLEWPFAEFEPAARASDLDGCPETATGDLLVQLSGTIDRIDVSRAGSTGLGGARKAAFDYKSGKAPLLARVDEGSYLQPAIYAAAIDTAGPDQGLVGGYLELSMDGTTSRRRLTGDPQVLEALHTEGRANTSFRRTSQPLNRWLLAAWLRRVDLYGQMLGSGIFPPTLAGPVVAGCEHCSFRRACRYDSVRTGRVTAPSGRLGTLLPVPLPVSRFQPENDEETSP